MEIYESLKKLDEQKKELQDRKKQLKYEANTQLRNAKYSAYYIAGEWFRNKIEEDTENSLAEYIPKLAEFFEHNDKRTFRRCSLVKIDCGDWDESLREHIEKHFPPTKRLKYYRNPDFKITEEQLEAL